MVNVINMLNQIKKWFSNPYNSALFALIIFSLVIRIYFLIKTSSQPLWWDEADYVNLAKSLISSLDYPFDPVRQPLFPLIFAFFFKIYPSEIFLRLFMILISTSSVVGAYYLGKKAYDEKTALISSFFISVSYIILFFGNRLLIDVPSMTFYLFSALFFFLYIKFNKPPYFYISSVIIAIGTLARLTTAVLLLVFLLYFLFTSKFSFIKKKETWVAGSIFSAIILPYILWGFVKFNGFVITMAGGVNAPENYVSNFFLVLKNYLILFPSYFSWPLTILFIIGLISCLKFILGFDVLFKSNDFNNLKRDFFILLLFIAPLLFISFSINHNEDRYILASFPALFLIASRGFMILYNKTKKYSRTISVILLIALIIFVGYYQINESNKIIELKKDSYAEVKLAGEWLKQNTRDETIIFTRSLPQTLYYSERKTYGISEEKNKFEQSFNNQSSPILIISIFESHPEWIYSFPEEKGMSPIRAYLDENKNPLLIIYKLK